MLGGVLRGFGPKFGVESLWFKGSWRAGNPWLALTAVASIGSARNPRENRSRLGFRV